jgi:hypothetical protein
MQFIQHRGVKPGAIRFSPHRPPGSGNGPSGFSTPTNHRTLASARWASPLITEQPQLPVFEGGLNRPPHAWPP